MFKNPNFAHQSALDSRLKILKMRWGGKNPPQRLRSIRRAAAKQHGQRKQRNHPGQHQQMIHALTSPRRLR